MNTVDRTLELLEERNMSLYQLAQACGISHTTITRTKKRGGDLQMDTLRRICDVLGITLSEFFDESDVKEKKKPQKAGSYQNASV